MSGSEKITGQITLSANGESHKLPLLPKPVISAIHEFSVGTKDHIESQLYRSVGLRIDDIEQVSAMLDQWMNQYDVQSRVFQIISTHRKIKENSICSRRLFRSLEAFSSKTLSSSDPISLLQMKFSFILRNPNTEQLESYDIDLEFPEWVEWRPRLLEKSEKPFNELDNEYEVVPRTLSSDKVYSLKIRIEYSDYITATSLQKMLEGWYSNIDNSSRSWKIHKPKFYEKWLDYDDYRPFTSGRFLCRWVPFVSSAMLVVAFLSLTSSTMEVHYLILACTSLFFFFAIIFDYIIRNMLQKAIFLSRSTDSIPLLYINKGNQLVFDKMKEIVGKNIEKSQLIGRRLFYTSIGTIALGIVANIVSQVIIIW